MSETSTHEKIMGTGYNSEAWHYRHGIAWATAFLFALFVLCIKTLWGGVKGLVSGFTECLQSDIKPMFAKTGSEPQPADDKKQEPAPEQAPNE